MGGADDADAAENVAADADEDAVGELGGAVHACDDMHDDSDDVRGNASSPAHHS